MAECQLEIEDHIEQDFDLKVEEEHREKSTKRKASIFRRSKRENTVAEQERAEALPVIEKTQKKKKFSFKRKGTKSADESLADEFQLNAAEFKNNTKDGDKMPGKGRNFLEDIKTDEVDVEMKQTDCDNFAEEKVEPQKKSLLKRLRSSKKVAKQEPDIEGVEIVRNNTGGVGRELETCDNQKVVDTVDRIKKNEVSLEEEVHASNLPVNESETTIYLNPAESESACKACIEEQVMEKYVVAPEELQLTTETVSIAQVNSVTPELDYSDAVSDLTMVTAMPINESSAFDESDAIRNNPFKTTADFPPTLVPSHELNLTESEENIMQNNENDSTVMSVARAPISERPDVQNAIVSEDAMHAATRNTAVNNTPQENPLEITSENIEHSAPSATSKPCLSFVLVDKNTSATKPNEESFLIAKKAMKVYRKANLSQTYCQSCCSIM